MASLMDIICLVSVVCQLINSMTAGSIENLVIASRVGTSTIVAVRWSGIEAQLPTILIPCFFASGSILLMKSENSFLVFSLSLDSFQLYVLISAERA